jgi:hypothetical protein
MSALPPEAWPLWAPAMAMGWAQGLKGCNGFCGYLIQGLSQIHCDRNVRGCFFEMGSCYAIQARYNLLGSALGSSVSFTPSALVRGVTSLRATALGQWQPPQDTVRTRRDFILTTSP